MGEKTSKGDQLRALREAQYARRMAKPKPTVTELKAVVTKLSVASVTKLSHHRKRGRPAIGDQPLTQAERARRYRAKARLS